MSFSKIAALLMVGSGLAAAARAGVIDVPAGQITTSTTWTANNTYRLKGQVFVTNFATLTIEPGVVIASLTADKGALIVTPNAKIVAVGTANAPIIFTSQNDVDTWAVDPTHPTGKNPKTGTWRAAASEWGNLTIMGNAYISENVAPLGGTNTAFPSATNKAAMEGLTTGTALDTYGGGNDDDDSGSLSYVSIRYNGLPTGVVGVELNGLSLGGVGRLTDIDHVDIMNGLDDGIEIWGGTVNLKYLNIWNVGDDAFDLDQGWRGKAQFGLIVQGYSTNAAQGSGVGDNSIEVDGAEAANYQPVTSATIYNFTVIGNNNGSLGGDMATAFRDNARLQIRNSIIMDTGEMVIKNDGDAGEGLGGFNVLTFAQTFAAPFNQYSPVNPPQLPLTYADLYKTQVDGNLSEVSDTVFFNNTFGTAYSDAVIAGAFSNPTTPLLNNVLATLSPVRKVVRGTTVNPSGTLLVTPVIGLDPRGQNDATTSVGQAPNDGFFTPANYRGAFDANTNWALGWTAADAYSFFDVASAVVRTGANNVPSSLTANGLPTLGNAGFGFSYANPTASCGVTAGSFAITALNFNGAFSFPIFDGCSGGNGTLLINLFGPIPSITKTGAFTGAPGVASFPVPNDLSISGASASAQAFFFVPSSGRIVPSDAVDIVIGH